MATDEVTVTFTRRQAQLVRGSLMAYRSAVEHVHADTRPHAPYPREMIQELTEAKFVVEEAMTLPTDEADE